ncbi:predicted protein [Histoplasma mississippiense (nom. inval.)]|uniref:predicted protein n=1 Tax=Ajellomyces capsulatus (strain NAm1 / WU24) TaxID=2059318 RepID=UPI000157CAC8|nr:predicted protein [Histoplasma mississippiense (nom. inval.)]EDN09779.1 predicted protein [Histoplasma mississippiense (nom. inval.)]
MQSWKRSSWYLQDERHGSHGFSDGDEDRGQEKDDEFLPVSSPAVECGMVGSTGTNALPGDGSSTPVLDSTPHAGFLEPGSHRREWHRSSSDDPLLFHPLIVVESDDSAKDGRATSISHSPKADGGSDEAGTGIAGGRSISLKRQRRDGAGTGAMHPMVAVEVPVIADRLEEGMLSRLRTRQRKSRARSRREVPNAQDCKFPRKPVQCVEDDTTMSDTGSLSAHSDDTDDDYCASSEEDGPTKQPSKRRRLPTLPSGAALRRPQFQIPRAAAAAGREGVEQEDRVQATTAKDRYTTPRNTNHGPDTYAHFRPPIDDETRSCPLLLLTRGEAVMLSSTVAQVIFKMVTGRPMTASDLTDKTTAAADTERDFSKQKIKDLDGKRCCWTQKKDIHLVALKQNSFSWTEIEKQFPHRQLSFLQQQWYTKLQNTHTSNPITDKRRQEWNCKRAHSILICNPSALCDVSLKNSA